MEVKKKRNIKALIAYMNHGVSEDLKLKMKDILPMKKEDDEGLTELCILAEAACKEEGIVVK